MKKIAIIQSVAIVALIAAVLVLFQSKEKTAFLMNAELFDDFGMAKELDAKLKNIKGARQQVLDSLNLQMTALQRILGGAEKPAKEMIQQLNLLRQQHQYKQQQFADENDALSADYTKQIWTQLSQYVQDFGKQHQYDRIFGAQGEGNLMYANEADNVTNQLVEYANKRYQGK